MSTELIFVSYSSNDRPFAIGLAKELQQLGVNVWIDQLGIKLGENWDNAIENALEHSETLMLLISPTSVASQNVQDEVSIAINTNKKMVPILLKECKLPMRWQRRQFANLAENPDKAIQDILEFLGLEEDASHKLKDLLDLIDVERAPSKPADEPKSSSETVAKPRSGLAQEDQLVSDAEIDQAVNMNKRAIKKNWQTVGLIGLVSAVIIVLAMLNTELPVPNWMAIVAGLAINLFSISPIKNIRKNSRKIDLFELMKLNRARLVRVINKLSDKEIQEFNQQFNDYLSV